MSKKNISNAELRDIESFADQMFAKYGIDIEFSKHFLSRVNHWRNKPRINADELKALFRKHADRWGDNINRMDDDEEAVLQDLATFLNLPFVIMKKSDEKDVLIKTVMRKPDFKSGVPILSVESAQPVTKSQLDALEQAADKVFGKLGIDIEFTRHFLDRVNDERNVKQITLKELAELFVKEYKRWGRAISDMPISAQAVMKDLSSAINIPFVIKQDGDERDLVAKTVMRKPKFYTSDQELPVESVTHRAFESIARVHGLDKDFVRCEFQRALKIEESTVGVDVILSHLREMPDFYREPNTQLEEILQSEIWHRAQLSEAQDTKSTLKYALETLEKVHNDGDTQQDINSYAFDIVRRFDLKGIATARDLGNMFRQWKGIPAGDMVPENFKDGKKPGRKGQAKRSGVDCSKSVSALRKQASNSSGETQRMAHWCGNMKAGKQKK